MRARKGTLITAGVVLLLLLGGGWLAHGYIELLWFRSLGAAGVFWTSLGAHWLVGLAGAVAGGVLTLLNLWPARKALTLPRPQVITVDHERWVPPVRPVWLIAGAALVVAWMAGLAIGSQWLPVLRALHPVAFGGAPDPLFGKDAGFYVFQLPLLNLIYTFLMALLVANTVFAAVIYAAGGALNWLSGRVQVHPRTQAHLSLLVAGFFVLKAWGYWLAAYELVYSPRGVAFGASYTDVHANLPGLRILMVLALALAVLSALSAVRLLLRPVVAGLALYAAASLVLGLVYPALMQQFVVKPSEIQRETPYINYNIEMTRRAYNLGAIHQQDYPATGTLAAADVTAQNPTIANVRLWDWKVMGKAYQQLQGLRSYYSFDDMGVDRYLLGGKTSQVLLSAREVDYSKLPQQTWINQHLKYTHGYGIALSPAAKVGPDGFPEFWLKDVPPTATVPELKVDRPEIYFGEQTEPYAIVDTLEAEFDYPKGDTNAYNRYEGKGGIPVGSLLTRLAFAVDQGDGNLLFSGAITGQSQALLYRNIRTRVQKLAPYLLFDQDPLLVIDQGRAVWVIDAYTTTDQFPYSEPTQDGTNYIRNSVKVTVGAYDGDVRFYMADPADPLVQSYARIFPGVYHPLSEMSAGLRAHLRYPEHLFAVQGAIYASYHMTDPQVFYNKEDRWQVAQEGAAVGTSQSKAVDPYYATVQLPGQATPEYLLMQPFTPSGRSNMVAFLAARSDPEHYGEVIAYRFPKDRNIPGPQQVESNVNTTPAISQSLSLWNQQGSQVTMGPLFVIPIKESLLYIQTLYLQGGSTSLPRLQRMIVSNGDQVAMAPSLEEALAQLFGQGAAAPPPPPTGTGVAPPPAESAAALVARANQLYQDAQTALKAGDFAAYGKQVQELGQVLQRLQELSGGKPPAPPAPPKASGG